MKCVPLSVGSTVRPGRLLYAPAKLQKPHSLGEAFVSGTPDAIRTHDLPLMSWMRSLVAILVPQARYSDNWQNYD